MNAVIHNLETNVVAIALFPVAMRAYHAKAYTLPS